nr:MAG TPA: hypothetical protein [Caudoviricetes sp.]
MLFRQRTAAHSKRVVIVRVILRLAHGVIVDEGACPRCCTGKLLFRQGAAEICFGVKRVCCVHLRPSGLSAHGNGGSTGFRTVLLGSCGNGQRSIRLVGGDSQRAVLIDLRSSLNSSRAGNAPQHAVRHRTLAGHSGGKRLARALSNGSGSRGNGNGVDRTGRSINRERAVLRQGVVVRRLRVRDFPAETHNRTQSDHVILHEVVNDGVVGRILHNALIENLERDVLTDRVHQLRPVTSKHKRLGSVESAVAREVHGGAVQRIRRRALHIGFEDGIAVQVFQTAQLRTHLDSGHNAVDEIAAFLDLGDHATLGKKVIINVRRRRNDGTGLRASLKDAVAPRGGLVRAKQDSAVNDLAERLDQTRADFAPDVIVGVVKHCLRNGDDNSDLFGIDFLLVPLHLGGLLHAGIAVHEVGSGKHVQNVHRLGLAGHIGEAAAHLEDGASLGHTLNDLTGDRFRDKPGKVGSVYNVSSHILPHKLLKFAPNQGIHSVIRAIRTIAAVAYVRGHIHTHGSGFSVFQKLVGCLFKAHRVRYFLPDLETVKFQLVSPHALRSEILFSLVLRELSFGGNTRRLFGVALFLDSLELVRFALLIGFPSLISVHFFLGGHSFGCPRETLCNDIVYLGLCESSYVPALGGVGIGIRFCHDDSSVFRPSAYSVYARRQTKKEPVPDGTNSLNVLLKIAARAGVPSRVNRAELLPGATAANQLCATARFNDAFVGGASWNRTSNGRAAYPASQIPSWERREPFRPRPSVFPFAP